MKSKLLLLDLGICTVWMLSLLGGRHGWYYPAFAFAMLGLLMRIVVSPSPCTIVRSVPGCRSVCLAC